MKKIAVAQNDEPVQSVALSTAESMLAGALTSLKERVTAALNEVKQSEPKPEVAAAMDWGASKMPSSWPKTVMKKTKFTKMVEAAQTGVVKLTGALIDKSDKYLQIQFPGKASAWYKKSSLESFEEDPFGQDNPEVTVTMTTAFAKRRGLSDIAPAIT